MTEHQKQRFHEGIDLFNTGRFFECHEVLEEVWLEFSGDRKKFLQGLIQLTVALHHLKNNNRVGAERLLVAAADKLALDSPEREIIDIDSLLAAITRLQQAIGNQETPPADWTPPKIHSRI
jgi:predicted metal-dependent hydrolase